MSSEMMRISVWALVTVVFCRKRRKLLGTVWGVGCGGWGVGGGVWRYGVWGVVQMYVV